MMAKLHTVLGVAWALWTAFWLLMLAYLFWDSQTTKEIKGPGAWMVIAMATFTSGVSVIALTIHRNKDMR